MATALVTDTYKAISFLQKKKFSVEQSEGIVEFVEQHIDISKLATKEDLKDLKLDLYKALAGQTIVILGVVVAMLQFLK
ncbi:MAG: hypothetical protein AAB734_03175 [Patescibacteria group bacterium]